MQIIKLISLSGTLLCSLISLHAQNINPNSDEIFKEDEVTEIRMTMSDGDKTTLHAEENRYADLYMSTAVTFTNSELDDVLVSNVGVRLRGNTARDHDKRSYKIDFTEYDGEKFEGHKKLNLKPEVNDPALVRELLTMRLFRKMGVPAPRVGPAALYINEEYMGVYLMVEQIDDEFVDRRFGHEEGFLYKCAYSATLESASQTSDVDLYTSKMNESQDTRAELSNFVNVLNNTAESNFEEEIEKVFNVDRFLRYLAVEAITGHWDGYSYLCNNYYLFYDAQTSLVEFIAYDTDNTWGIDWIGRDWANRDLNHFYRNNQQRPLVSEILKVPSYNTQYYAYLHELFDHFFTEEYLYPRFDELENILLPYVTMDTYFDDSFGFSSGDFSNAFDYTNNQQAKYGLRDYVETRRSSGIGSIPELVLQSRELSALNIYPNPSAGGQFNLKNGAFINSHPRLFDISGVEFPVSIEGNTGAIQTPDTPGVYFLHLEGRVYPLIVK